MITDFAISNFKSLADFEIALPKFSVLIGLNGAGKTTLLQALDFLSQTMHGSIDTWLASRGWDTTDIACKLLPASNIELHATTLANSHTTSWHGSFNRKELACMREFAMTGEPHQLEMIFQLNKRHYRMLGNGSIPVTFSYQGSILSQLRDTELSADLKGMRDTLRGIRSLELLSPHLMRQRTRDNADSIGIGGEKLSAYLHAVRGDDKLQLLEMLRRFYPRVVDFKSAPTKGGWKRLSIVEDFDGKLVESEVRHINDGLLRVLAMLAQTLDGDAMLLFDEVENGINPEIVEKLVNLLVYAKQQILVTTHNPMILNYLEDDVARKSVLFVYKTPEGFTRVRPFFSLPGVSEKLDLMGPGEAFVDTDLVALTAVCVELDEEEKSANKTTAKTKMPAISRKAAT